MCIQLFRLPATRPFCEIGQAIPEVRGMNLVNVEQLKNSVNRMSADVVREAVIELRLDGLVTEGKTPFNKLHFNTCFAEIEALFQRAGYHRQLDVVGYQGLLYALYDPGRWEAVDVLRWLKEFTDAAAQTRSIPA
ncbi:hypothetical protein PS874_03600 [Pseudomonas fluorescens]|jgi:hypothetical protein|nr:hypothetical protein PS874_03600 [Pseudomonas fluorescens]VVP41528.1 hypothetical protein PS838_04871 [Pseudomonas fluorescens]